DSETGRQAIRPDLRAIHAAVAIDVGQLLDRAVRPGLGSLLVPLVRLNSPHHAVELPRLVQLLDVVLPFQVVALQLTDEELPALIPADARRLADERLARDQLDAKPRGDPEVPSTLLGRKRPGGIVRLRNLAAGRARDSQQQEWSAQVPGVVHRVSPFLSAILTLSGPQHHAAAPLPDATSTRCRRRS